MIRVQLSSNLWEGCTERIGTYDLSTFFLKLRKGCSERIGTYEISTNRFESHGGTRRNVSGTCGNVMKIDSENNIQSAYRVHGYWDADLC